MPSSTISNSSFTLRQNHSSRFTSGNISTYAKMNRNIIIAAGESPSCNNSFELMNVVPQIADVRMAKI